MQNCVRDWWKMPNAGNFKMHIIVLDDLLYVLWLLKGAQS